MKKISNIPVVRKWLCGVGAHTWSYCYVMQDCEWEFGGVLEHHRTCTECQTRQRLVVISVTGESLWSSKVILVVNWKDE